MSKYPGVTRVGHQLYSVRAKWRCVKTGRIRAFVRIVEAVSAAEAAGMRAAIKAEASSVHEVPERERLRQCASSWIVGKAGELAKSTRSHYARTLDTYILPDLGDYYIDALTRADILAWRDKQKGEPITINGRLRVLQNVLGDVCRDRGMTNPAERIRGLREGGGDLDVKTKVLTADELRALLDAVREGSPQWYPLVLTLATTGARFGEATALTWTDIDEEARTIRIVRAQWHGHIDTTKTKTVRTVPLAAELADVLREHRDRLQARACGPVNRWIFPTEVGTLPRTTVLRKPLEKAATAAKLGKVPSNHWFRHTMSDLLRQVSAEVSAIQTEREKPASVAALTGLI